MKIYYRFPDLGIWDGVNQDYLELNNARLLQVVGEKNRELFVQLGDWFKLTMTTLPTPKLETFKDYQRDVIKCAMSFEVPDDIGMLFKLKFGDGYNGL